MFYVMAIGGEISFQRVVRFSLRLTNGELFNKAGSSRLKQVGLSELKTHSD